MNLAMLKCPQSDSDHTNIASNPLARTQTMKRRHVGVANTAGIIDVIDPNHKKRRTLQPLNHEDLPSSDLRTWSDDDLDKLITVILGADSGDMFELLKKWPKKAFEKVSIFMSFDSILHLK